MDGGSELGQGARAGTGATMRREIVEGRWRRQWGRVQDRFVPASAQVEGLDVVRRSRLLVSVAAFIGTWSLVTVLMVLVSYCCVGCCT